MKEMRDSIKEMSEAVIRIDATVHNGLSRNVQELRDWMISFRETRRDSCPYKKEKDTLFDKRVALFGIVLGVLALPGIVTFIQGLLNG